MPLTISLRTLGLPSCGGVLGDPPADAAPAVVTPVSLTPSGAGYSGDTYTLGAGTFSGYPAPTITLTLTLDGVDVLGEVVAGAWDSTGQDGTLVYTRTADNGIGSAAVSTVSVTVLATVVPSWNTPNTLAVTEGAALALVLDATNADAYVITGGTAAELMEIVSGELRWSSGSAPAAGSYTINLRATHVASGGTADLTIAVTVSEAAAPGVAYAISPDAAGSRLSSPVSLGAAPECSVTVCTFTVPLNGRCIIGDGLGQDERYGLSIGVTTGAQLRVAAGFGNAQASNTFWTVAADSSADLTYGELVTVYRTLHRPGSIGSVTPTVVLRRSDGSIVTPSGAAAARTANPTTDGFTVAQRPNGSFSLDAAYSIHQLYIAHIPTGAPPDVTQTAVQDLWANASNQIVVDRAPIQTAVGGTVLIDTAATRAAAWNAGGTLGGSLSMTKTGGNFTETEIEAVGGGASSFYLDSGGTGYIVSDEAGGNLSITFTAPAQLAAGSPYTATVADIEAQGVVVIAPPYVEESAPYSLSDTLTAVAPPMWADPAQAAPMVDFAWLRANAVEVGTGDTYTLTSSDLGALSLRATIWHPAQEGPITVWDWVIAPQPFAIPPVYGDNALLKTANPWVAGTPTQSVMWAVCTLPATATDAVMIYTLDANNTLEIQATSGGKLRVGSLSTNGVLLDFDIDGAPLDWGQEITILVASDAASGSTFYIRTEDGNGAEVWLSKTQTHSSSVITSEVYILRGKFGSPWTGSIQLYAQWIDQWLDLSVLENRRIFANEDGTPGNIVSAQAVIGDPVQFFRGPAASFATNEGTGSNLTLTSGTIGDTAP